MGSAADAWKIRFPGLIRFPVQRIGTERERERERGKKFDADASGCYSRCACIYQEINNPMEKCIRPE